jgi:putative transposase
LPHFQPEIVRFESVPRANRSYCEGRIWHVTQRCCCRAFLLKFVRDRRRWRHWLYIARRRYGLCVLNYVATSNHVHLLLVDTGDNAIARGMQLIAGRTAQEFNTRKNRSGAFWEGRYHATAVDSDSHLLQCITYIDLNMVRAGVVSHPRDWEVCGYNEIQSPSHCKQIIDFGKLMYYLGARSIDEVANLQNRRLVEEINTTTRNAAWTESFAVGSKPYILKIKKELASRGFSKDIIDNAGAWALRDGDIPAADFCPENLDSAIF